MPDLVLHSQTQQQLDNFLLAPSHAVLITGAIGIGKASVARQLAEKIMQLSENKLGSYAYALFISSDSGKAIGIEEIRAIEAFTAHKVPTSKQWHRVVLIENAQLLTTEAQNALLKTLEEPPQGTLLILTATSAQEVLPTIRSRVQQLHVTPPSKQASLDHFGSRYPESTPQLEQAYVISGGLPGLLDALLANTEHPLHEAVTTARSILSAGAFERQTMVESLAKKRDLCIQSLQILQQMAHLSLQPARNPSGAQARKWAAILEASYQAQAALLASAQPKLVLMDMMLRI